MCKACVSSFTVVVSLSLSSLELRQQRKTWMCQGGFAEAELQMSVVLLDHRERCLLKLFIFGISEGVLCIP